MRAPVHGHDATELLVEFLELLVDDVEAEMETVVGHEEHVGEERVLRVHSQLRLVLARDVLRGGDERRVRRNI